VQRKVLGLFVMENLQKELRLVLAEERVKVVRGILRNGKFVLMTNIGKDVIQIQ